MITPNEWLALAERCEKATGPDRDIERCICNLLPDRWQTMPFDGFTSSIDAIEALVDREFPVRFVTTSAHTGIKVYVRLASQGFKKTGIAPTEPNALCAAFCRLMAEKVASNG
jgi:hypothetical protein